MIRKIESIDNLAVFNGFQWNSSVLDDHGAPFDFEKINIIYGRNYSGKTCISRIMRALETRQIPEKYDNPSFSLICDSGVSINQSNLSSHNLNVRVFNEDFVRTNLRFLIDPDDEISSFAILGADNANIEAKIASIATELGSNIEGSESGLYEEKKKKTAFASQAVSNHKKATDDLDSKLSTKATDRASGIKYKPDRFGDQNYSITKIRTDIATVLSPTYSPLNDSQIQEHERTISEQARPQVQTVVSPVLSFSNFISRTKELLERTISSSNKITELLHDIALNEWVKKGVELNSEREVCAFCGSPISDERWKVLHAHFDEESKKLERDIDDCILQMEDEKKAIQSALTINKNLFYSTFHSRLDNIFAKFTSESKKYSAQLDSLINQLKKRKQQITEILQLNVLEDNGELLIQIFEEYNVICKEQNQYTGGLGRKQNAAKTALRLHEVSIFCSTIGYSSLLENIAALNDKKEKALTEQRQCAELIKAKEEEIMALRRQLNDEEAGAQRVNKYLTDYFGHEFLALQAVKEEGEETHIRFEIVRNGRKAYNLSEGECSLIAFCYFMAKLDDVDSNGKNLIIWIDDPISSLDGNHVFFVYSLLRAEIVEASKYEQLFISTHNLDFLKYLKRLTGKEHDRNVRYFLIKRQDKISIIEKMPNYLQKYVTEFNFLFHEIYKCSKIETIDDSNYTSFYNFGNNARKFLEILMFYYYPDETKQLEKLGKFFGEGLVPAILTDRINNEYSHLCGIFERGELPTEVPEMLKTAKLIMTTLSTKHPEQYAALIASVGEQTPSVTT